HVFRNGKSRRAKAMFALPSVHRLGLTGTMFNNDPRDLTSLATWIENRRVISSEVGYRFGGRLCGPEPQEWKKKYVIQRKQEDVLKLPPITQRVVIVRLSDSESAFYQKLALEALADFNLIYEKRGTG